MKDYNIKINYVHFNTDCVCIGWSANIGFGVLTIHQDNDDKPFEVETECLGDNFYKQVLDKFKEYLLKDYKIIE